MWWVVTKLKSIKNIEVQGVGSSVVYYANIELGNSIYFDCILCDLFTDKQKSIKKWKVQNHLNIITKCKLADKQQNPEKGISVKIIAYNVIIHKS